MQQTADTLPISEHFVLKQVDEGVYAAFGRVGDAPFSNAGIVDLGDQTLVLDTFESPEAARDLRLAAEHLTGRPVTYVLISHSHSDHWVGNQAFGPEVPIVTTHATRQDMPASIDWMEQLQEDPAELEKEIQEERELLETETDARQRVSLESSIARMEHLMTLLPTLAFRFPDLTFGGKLVFHGTRRTVELVEVAPGHTVSDAYLLLPEERVMFMGDLGFFQAQPFMAFCDPRAWQAWLEEMEQSDVETFVPGHGPLGTKADLALQREYIAILETLVAQAIEDGLSLEETLERPLPAPFDAWLHGGMSRWEANVHFMHERLSGNGPE